MIDERTGDDAFADRIAGPLRAPEKVDATFEARAMSAVHAADRAEAEARRTRRPWLLRPYALQLSPLTAFAVAACLMVAALAGSLLVRRPTTAATNVAARDTVHVVRFVFVDSSARRVALVGVFNHWEKDATLLSGTGVHGVWTVDVPLSAGRHEYAFVVYDDDGEHWVADPLSQIVRDEFGTESSMMVIGRTS